MKDYIKQIEGTSDIKQLEEIKVFLFGKNGIMTEQLKTLGKMSAEERKTAGEKINREKTELQNALAKRFEKLTYEKMMSELAPQKIDVSRPCSSLKTNGKIHPLTHVKQTVYAILSGMGFSPATGPEIEDDFHNFTALNVAENHPARDMQDSFYLDAEFLMRTQTSAVQIRALEKYGAPIKVFSTGKCYRREIDATHTPMFHQIEGLVLGENITMNHLLGTVKEFMKLFFNLEEIPMRIRPSYFPFTEPSIEIDFKWDKKTGIIGTGNDWLELMGAGMVHPNVIKNAGLNPEKVQGYAFGFGMDRITMIKYGIPDLRSFFRGDIRWLEHYGFNPDEIPSTSSNLD